MSKKLSDRDIAVSDLEEYLNANSDFDFELKILRRMRSIGFECDHGGHYEDPVTRKSREFDIRAKMQRGTRAIRIALECKNLRPNFPLLVSCVPRREEECFHEFLYSDDDLHKSESAVESMFQSRGISLRLSASDCLYHAGSPVGKSTSQVGRAQDGSLVANDSEIYEKWSQCLSSLNDLIDQAYYEGAVYGGGPHHCTFLPMVVIPNGRLWSVGYDEGGQMVSPITVVERCSFYVDKEYRAGGKHGVDVSVSHLEIVTEDGLVQFLESELKSDDGFFRLMPRELVRKAVRGLH